MDKQQWVNGEFVSAHGPAVGTVEPAPKQWPNEVQRSQDFFWTRSVARPTRETWEFRMPTLEEAQAIWDTAHGKVASHEARMAEMDAEREGRERSAQDARAKAFATQQAAAATARENELRAIHLSNGGTTATWGAERAVILAADRQKRTLEGESPIRSLIGPREMLAG